MKGFPVVLHDENAKPMSEQEEIANILGMSYASLAQDFIAKTKQLRMIGLVLLFLLPPIGLILLIVSHVRRAKCHVSRIGKGYWVGTFHDFEGGNILVDESELTTPMILQIPVPNLTPQDMVETVQKARRLIEAPPLLSRRKTDRRQDMPSSSTDQDADHPLDGIVDRLDHFSRGLESGREESVSVGVIAANSPMTQAIVRDIGPAQTITPRNAVGAGKSQAGSELAKLEGMTRIAREETEGSRSVEDLAETMALELESLVADLDKVQRVSLVEILQGDLRQLEQACRSPMLFYYCPHCLKAIAENLNLNLRTSLARSIGGYDDAHLLNDQSAERLSDAVTRFAASSRATVMRLERHEDEYLNCSVRRWRCGLCSSEEPVENDGRDEIVKAHRAAQELVLPLWDQLWMEISSERAGLLERKDKEQRDNIRHEHQDMVHSAEQFAEDAREAKNRRESLLDRAYRATDTYGSLINTFVESGLLRTTAVETIRADLAGIHQQFASELDDLLHEVSQIEERLQRECEDVTLRRKPLVDLADHLKMSSQFVPDTEEAEEALVIDTSEQHTVVSSVGG